MWREIWGCLFAGLKAAAVKKYPHDLPPVYMSTSSA